MAKRRMAFCAVVIRTPVVALARSSWRETLVWNMGLLSIQNGWTLVRATRRKKCTEELLNRVEDMLARWKWYRRKQQSPRNASFWFRLKVYKCISRENFISKVWFRSLGLRQVLPEFFLPFHPFSINQENSYCKSYPQQTSVHDWTRLGFVSLVKFWDKIFKRRAKSRLRWNTITFTVEIISEVRRLDTMPIYTFPTSDYRGWWMVYGTNPRTVRYVVDDLSYGFPF